MARRALLSAFFSIFTCLLHAQPVQSGYRLFSGKPLQGFVVGSDVFMVTTKGIFKTDSSGNVVATDSLFSINASAFDGFEHFYLTGVMDTNGIPTPYVRKLTTSLQEVYSRLLVTAGSYLPTPTSIACNGQDRIYVGGSSFDSSSTPSHAQYFAGLDTLGNVAWSFVYGVGADEQAFKTMKCDHNGNAVMGSDVGLTGPAAGEMHFRKFDSSGNFLYENLFDPVYAKDLLNDFTFGSGGQTFLTGPFNLTGIIGNTVSALVVFDSTGLFNGFSTFDGYGFDEKQHITADGSGNLYGIVSGTDHSGPMDAHFDVMKFDENGIMTWSNRHRDGAITYQEADALSLVGSGKIFVVGEHRDDTLSLRSGLIVVFDTNGTFDYETIASFPGKDVFFSGFIDVSDSMYYTYGHHIDSNGDTMTVLVKYQNTITSVSEPEAADAFLIFPNPAQDYFSVIYQERILRLNVVDFSGRLMKSIVGQGHYGFDIRELPSGHYNVTIETENESLQSKLVIE